MMMKTKVRSCFHCLEQLRFFCWKDQFECRVAEMFYSGQSCCQIENKNSMLCNYIKLNLNYSMFACLNLALIEIYMISLTLNI